MTNCFILQALTTKSKCLYTVGFPAWFPAVLNLSKDTFCLTPAILSLGTWIFTTWNVTNSLCVMFMQYHINDILTIFYIFSLCVLQLWNIRGAPSPSDFLHPSVHLFQFKCPPLTLDSNDSLVVHQTWWNMMKHDVLCRLIGFLRCSYLSTSGQEEPDNL